LSMPAIPMTHSPQRHRRAETRCRLSRSDQSTRPYELALRRHLAVILNVQMRDRVRRCPLGRVGHKRALRADDQAPMCNVDSEIQSPDSIVAHSYSTVLQFVRGDFFDGWQETKGFDQLGSRCSFEHILLRRLGIIGPYPVSKKPLTPAGLAGSVCWPALTSECSQIGRSVCRTGCY
jgi:hypothetical protein